MSTHLVSAAPSSALPEARRGRIVGRFCHGCDSFYPLFASRHAGKPSHGRDHVASTCSHEGEAFSAGADWWEPAVEALASPPAPSAPKTS